MFQLKPKYFIDSHVHLMTPYRTRGGIKWIRRAVKEYKQLSLDVTTEDLLAQMKGAGADYIINYFYPLHPGESREINRWQRELADRHPEIIPFASLHPGDNDKMGIIKESLGTLKLAGFKFHPYIQDFNILDPGMEPVFGALQEAGCPVNIHTGFSIFYGKESLKEDFEVLLQKYPMMKVIAAHMLCGDMSLRNWPELMERHPNLYLDATNAFSFFKPGSKSIVVMREIIKKYSKRMVFGSDYPMGMAYPVKLIYDLVEQVCPDQETMEDLAWRTAAELVGLDPAGVGNMEKC